MLAYTPSAPPLTPAARAEIVAALCERAKRKQVANAAASAATKAKWNAEMAMIKQCQSRRASFNVEQPQASNDVLLPTPTQQSATTFSAGSSSSSSSTYAASEPAVTAPGAASTVASSAVETKLPEGTQTQDRSITGMTPSSSTGSSSRSITSSSIPVPDKVNTETEQDVANNADTQPPTSSGRSIKVTTKKVTRSIPGAKTGVIRPSMVDAIWSALKELQARSSSDNAPAENDDEGKEDVDAKPSEFAAEASALEQVLDKGEKLSDTKEEVNAVSRAEPRVIRPNMIDALGSLLSKLQLVKQIRQGLGTTTASTTGAITAFFSMKD